MNYKLTEGPDELAADAACVELLMKEPDCAEVLALEPIGHLQYIYLIRTPFTFPAFAVGSCSHDLEEVQILLTCGSEWCARDNFARIIATENNLTD